MTSSSLQGRLLVANPRLPDPNFDRTVVLVVAHGEEGALGLVLNRPSDAPVSDSLPGWEDVASAPAVVFVGGPVDTTTVICLANNQQQPVAEGWVPVAGDVGTFDVSLGPDSAAAGVEGLRVFAGYAGWGSGQLEGEIGAGGWFVVDAEPGDAVSGDPGSLWRRVLRRQRSTLALVAAYPADPAMN
ncbi:MAG TPA: YqgE/AlgH family protein [Acidimicrobiales bacterium]|jgi:putative transcriptional regulator|nr:YqgE/AlgH family protein [Acidimicrobiales bacterium]